VPSCSTSTARWLHTSPDSPPRRMRRLPNVVIRRSIAKLVEDFVGKGIDVLIQRCLKYIGQPETGPVFDTMRVAYMRHYAAFKRPARHALSRRVRWPERAARHGNQAGRVHQQDGHLHRSAAGARRHERLFRRDGERRHGGEKKARCRAHPLGLQALGTLPEETLMVGDSGNDAGAARAAGAPVLIVPYGYKRRRNRMQKLESR